MPTELLNIADEPCETGKIRRIPVILAFEKITKDSIWYKKAIGYWTKSNYCHVEVILNNTWISAHLKNGVHISPLKPLKDEYDYFKLEDSLLLDNDYLYLIDWLNKQNHKKYDLTAIFLSQILPLRYDDTNKWFCSEIVTRILQMLGYKEVYNLYPQMVSPADLADIFKDSTRVTV